MNVDCGHVCQANDDEKSRCVYVIISIELVTSLIGIITKFGVPKNRVINMKPPRFFCCLFNQHWHMEILPETLVKRVNWGLTYRRKKVNAWNSRRSHISAGKIPRETMKYFQFSSLQVFPSFCFFSVKSSKWERFAFVNSILP